MLQPPKLSVEPQEINLGAHARRHDRKLELKLENQGGRLLYGTVTCAATAGSASATSPASRRRRSSSRTTRHCRSRSSATACAPATSRSKTQIVIESSGGTKTITVRAEVPVKAFPAGASGRRQKPAPGRREGQGQRQGSGRVLFERGDVRKWYKDNGWTYPVQGRDASGLGAVQQFFEALGLTPAPKVDDKPSTVGLAGDAGQRLQHTIEVKTEEKRPVYADGNSDRTWLEVGRAQAERPRRDDPADGQRCRTSPARRSGQADGAGQWQPEVRHPGESASRRHLRPRDAGHGPGSPGPSPPWRWAVPVAAVAALPVSAQLCQRYRCRLRPRPLKTISRLSARRRPNRWCPAAEVRAAAAEETPTWPRVRSCT